MWQTRAAGDERPVEPGPAPGRHFVVIGGGPAGLTAAYELTRLGHAPVVLEKSDSLGGIARTEVYKGFHFDMGGHRFFTKSEEVARLWSEVLGAEFLRRPRLSRIYYRGKFFHYPLRVVDALLGLGVVEALRIGLSYLRACLAPCREEETFEQWVTNRFGRRLFEIFFKTYTEKVWGLPCSELRAEWAAQRIRDLSLRTLLVSLFLKPGNNIKTLIEEFHYPRLGPGMMWRAFGRQVEERGGTLQRGCEVVGLRRDGLRIESVRVRDARGERDVAGTDFISSMPVTELVARLDPPAPAAVREAAAGLSYRAFLTVCLIVDRPQLFPDNWIYVHEPGVRVARIQNFKNWSPDMVPDASRTSLGLEYFCNEGDETWSLDDAELIELGQREIERVGLARAADVVDGCVFRVPKAYPVYDSAYRDRLAVVRDFADSLENCRTVGRNGLHRYNNQDHSMLTALLAVRQSVFGEQHDLWSVNADAEYHEETRAPARPPSVDALLARAFGVLLARLDPVAAGVAAGAVAAALLVAMTLTLVLRGGPAVPNLYLLAQFFPGYRVSYSGALVGLCYGGGSGFLAGWGLAHVRNRALRAYVELKRWRTRRALLRRLLDEV